MSSISSIGGSGLTQFLQSVVKNKPKQAGQKAGAASSLPSTSSPSAAQQALFTQIEQNVTSALQQARSNNSSKDPNQIIEDSVASVLKNFLSGKTPPSASGTSAAETNQAFQSALKTFGITPQQFQNDFKLAAEDAQNSSQNFGVGNLLDVTG